MRTSEFEPTLRKSQLGMLDATGAHTLAEIITELEARGITVIINGVQPEQMNLLANVGCSNHCATNHLTDSLNEAIVHARSHTAAAPGQPCR